MVDLFPLLASNIRVVLCNTSHQGNIGSAARAMKTMGITELYLVNPVNSPDDHAIALSSNAADVVINAKICSSLSMAISDCHLVAGMTSRRRELAPKLETPRELSAQIYNTIASGYKVALVFGNEKFGLSIQELEQCNHLVTILGNPQYFSLNLSQAVQIICYEIFSGINFAPTHLIVETNPSSIKDNQLLLQHIEDILDKTGYKKVNEERVSRRLQRIINKASLEREEVDMLRGMLRSIDKAIIQSE